MSEALVKEGSSVEELLEMALVELDAERDEIEYEILVEPEKKMFGKNTPAKIKVWLKEDIDEIEEEETPSIGSNEEEFPLVDGICDEEKQPFSPEHEELSEEELDQVADTAIETLRSILSYFGVSDASIDEYEGDEGEILLDIVGEDLAVLIGRHGKTLDSLQFLVSSIVNRKLGYRYPVVIDIEGYKYRRKQKIEGIAKSAASRAARQNTSVRLRPMTPYERRLVHIALRDDNRVMTVSEGEEPNRLVVIKPNRF